MTYAADAIVALVVCVGAFCLVWSSTQWGLLLAICILSLNLVTSNVSGYKKQEMLRECHVRIATELLQLCRISSTSDLAAPSLVPCCLAGVHLYILPCTVRFNRAWCSCELITLLLWKSSWHFLAPFVLVSITISFLNCCSPFYTLLVSTNNNKPIGFL